MFTASQSSYTSACALRPIQTHSFKQQMDFISVKKQLKGLNKRKKNILNDSAAVILLYFTEIEYWLTTNKMD